MAADELHPPCWPKGFNEDDFNFSKLFKCVNSVGEHVMRDVVRAMYSHPSLKSDGGNKTLQKYFIDIGWSKRNIKDKITKLHVEFLEENLNDAEFDISFACVIMTDACKDLWNKLSNTATTAVEELKKMRNKICHKYGIDSAELCPLADNLKRILKDIYIGVGDVVDKDFSGDVNNMESAIQGIVVAKIQHIDIDTYLEDVKKFRTDLKFFMINKGKEEFHSSYSKLRIMNPCIWMTEEEIENTALSRYQVDTIFTPLKIEHSRHNIEIADIFTVTKKIKGSEQKPSALVMHGLAGCGKTSLCHFVIHEWCKNSDKSIIGIEDFDLIIFVEIRRVRSKSLLAFLTDECMVQTCKTLQPGDIIPTLKDLNILVVIDGFDEAKKGVSLELVNDIFCKFPDKRILVTTRPEYKDDVLCISRKFYVSFLQIQICGFDEKGLKIFSEKVFAALEKDEQRREKELSSFLGYMETTGKVLDEHLKLPLTLSLLIYLWREDSTIVFRIASATMLYLEIFNLCQKRLSERLEKQGRGKLKDELNEVTFCLGEQAWLLLLEGDLLLLTDVEFNSLKRECRSRSVDVINFLSTYLYCETDENEDLQKRKFAFLHKTQMEYLAGAYLADSATLSSYKKLSFGEIDAEVEEKSEWRNLQEVVKYMTGSMAITQKLKEKEISHIFEILDKVNVPHDDFNFWWNFYLETLNNCSAGRKIIHKLPLSDWSLNEKNVVSGLKFYRDLKPALETLKIEIPININPYDIKDLLPILEEIQGQKLKRKRAKKQIDPVSTELHFWNQENYYGSLSDNFINTLYPWGHLTNFTGSLGEKEVLTYCLKLKNIRVRLNTVNAVRAFKQSLNRIWKSVKTLRLTLGVPFDCSPSDLCDLQYNDKFELTLKGTKDEHKEWIVDVVKQINGRNGCLKLSLLNSEITHETIVYLLKKLKNIIHEKISLNTIFEPSNNQLQQLERLQERNFIEINWLPH